MIKTPFTGGCLCGAVRYTCTANPKDIWMFRCHCRDCQHVSGGGHTPALYIMTGEVRIEGEVRHHSTQGQNGLHIRGYCPKCGSRVTGGQMEGSKGIGVTAASLDDPSGFEPQAEIWVSDAQPWDPLIPNIPHFAKNPPQ